MADPERIRPIESLLAGRQASAELASGPFARWQRDRPPVYDDELPIYKLAI
jgi:hypothetical protein